MKNICLYFFCFVSYYMISCNNQIAKADTLSDKASNELRSVLHEQPQFIKVHAAEFLIWLGHNDEVKKVFLKEDSLYGNESPYRIGIWRVLAQAEEKNRDKEFWINKIFEVFGDTTATDRLHATETLAKLKQSPLEKYSTLTKEALNSTNRNLKTYALWAVSYSSDSAMEKNKNEFLHLAMEDHETIVRKISAYILRKIDGLNVDEWISLANKAIEEPETSEMRHSLLNTAFVTLPSPTNQTQLYQIVEKAMLKNSDGFSAGERIELALSLADKGGSNNIPVLQSMLDNENSNGIYATDSKEAADVRAAAAYAILKILKRADK